MTVAFFEIDGGAALIALAMVAASEPPPPFLAIVSCPDFALGSSLSLLALSWAETVNAAMTNMPVATAIAFRMAPSVGCGLGASVAYRPSRRLAAWRIEPKRCSVKRIMKAPLISPPQSDSTLPPTLGSPKCGGGQ